MQMHQREGEGEVHHRVALAWLCVLLTVRLCYGYGIRDTRYGIRDMECLFVEGGDVDDDSHATAYKYKYRVRRRN